MKLETATLEMFVRALGRLEEGFADLPDIAPGVEPERIEAVLLETAERMQHNYPYFHPLYAGQMLKPPHPVARLAYMLSLWINPNNHALDGGRASSQMEKEATAQMAAMFGWQTFLGHLTSGGTMANLEALWVSGRLQPGKTVVASAQAHYTHQRISEVLGLKFQSVSTDDRGHMDLDALETMLKTGEVGTVVTTIGSTGTGSVDPLPEILVLQQKYGFRVHVDAAYGGYFHLASNLSDTTRRVYNRLGEVDSIVVDPHKHGLQPYGCGCVLFRDPEVGRFYRHDSPYTYFTSKELHLGEISLECSRAGASAVALWATLRLLPLLPGGEFARGLEASRRAALALYAKISEDDRFLTLFSPELDIVVWAPRGASASQISQRSQAIFEAAQAENLHLAVFKYPAGRLQNLWPNVNFDEEMVVCLRSVLMKPEHEAWLDTIWETLSRAANSVLTKEPASSKTNHANPE